MALDRPFSNIKLKKTVLKEVHLTKSPRMDRYTVIKVINSLEPVPGTHIEKSKVQTFIDDESVKVVITER